MKSKIYFLVLGILIGAIVAVLGIFLYVKFTDRTTINEDVPQMNFEGESAVPDLPDEGSSENEEALDKPENGNNEEPPEIPDGEEENNE